MKLVLALLALVLLTACSSSDAQTPAEGPTEAAPTSWLGMQPGDARAFDGPGGELVLIYVDETYDVGADDYASATTLSHGDHYTTDYWIQDDDGTVWWYGRKGEWRAGRNGEEPREVSLAGGTATFGDVVITLSGDGPTQVETPHGVYTPS
ncbi:hypothetical protein [Nocardioides sp. SR21]|uniref:hypothetical protein n=1 Tax=Nocardioides sp. SR21 TaxID=2919501 RepID=UPI001FAA934D|nr:hypothetical protein [Nocardioides sp. SR21]